MGYTQFLYQYALRRQVAEGQAHYKEPVVMAALLEMADASAQARAAEALPVLSPPASLESVSPCGAEHEPMAAPADVSVAALEDALLQGEVSPAKMAQLWQGPIGAVGWFLHLAAVFALSRGQETTDSALCHQPSCFTACIQKRRRLRTENRASPA